MPRPSLIILWILLAWEVGSSRLKPEARREVSKSRRLRSLTDLSFLSASDLSLRLLMMGWSGLISRCFLAAMYPMVLVSRRAWAFMMRSMLADQPYWEVTMQQGDVTRRLDTTTFSTLLSRISFMTLQSPSNLALASSNFFFSSSSSGSSRPSLITQTRFLPSFLELLN